MKSVGGVGGRAPVALRRVIDPKSLTETDPCDVVYVLGSFWPYNPASPESRIVKTLKGCYPTTQFEPHISRLCAFYANMIAGLVKKHEPDWITRVLSSREEHFEPLRPQSLMLNLICEYTGACEAPVFFKSGSRPPMRTIGRLSGRAATIRRMNYALQELFIRPTRLLGSVLLLDDIMNTGASMRIYARALKEYCEAESVIGVNLAVTRFGPGDGWDGVGLDLSAYPNTNGLKLVWIDQDNIYHAERNCTGIGRKARCELAFTLEKQSRPCPECAEPARTARRSWFYWR